MADLADAFIAIPGGFGTLEELLEVVTWNQIGFMVKPVGVLNVCGYFDHLLKFFDHAVQEVCLQRRLPPHKHACPPLSVAYAGSLCKMSCW